MQLIELNETEYKEFTSNNNAHFLESYEWGELSKKRGYTPYYIGLKDNSIIKCSALLLKKDLPLGYSYFYIPRGYTIDFKDYKLLEEFTKRIKEFAKPHKAIFFRMDPAIKLHTINELAEKIDGDNNYELVDFLEKIGFKHRKLTKFFETTQPRYTFRMDLTKNIDEIIMSYSKTARNNIKRADSYGVTVKVGEREDISEFVRLMKMTEKRQNFYSHTESFYYDFYDVFSKNNHLKLLLAELDFKNIVEVIDSKIEEVSKKKKIDTDHLNKLKKEKEFFLEKLKIKEKAIVSAYIMVYYGNKSWYLYGANDMEYKDAFSNYKIFDYQVKMAKENRIEIFDLFGTIGDPKADTNLIGIHDFKKKWGGEYTEFIGEFDFVLNKLMYFAFTKLIPIWHRLVNKKLRKKGE